LLLFRGKDLPRKSLQSSSFISFVNCSNARQRRHERLSEYLHVKLSQAGKAQSLCPRPASDNFTAEKPAHPFEKKFLLFLSSLAILLFLSNEHKTLLNNWAARCGYPPPARRK
jgi:hypothetical protein